MCSALKGKKNLKKQQIDSLPFVIKWSKQNFIKAVSLCKHKENMEVYQLYTLTISPSLKKLVGNIAFCMSVHSSVCITILYADLYFSLGKVTDIFFPFVRYASCWWLMLKNLLPYFKKTILLKERICFLGKQILSFRRRPLKISRWCS